MTEPQAAPPHAALRGTAVLTLADVMKLPHGELREVCLLSIVEHLRGSHPDISVIQLYLTAKALLEERELDLSGFGIHTEGVVEECRDILGNYYPALREQPNIQQMISVLKAMSLDDTLTSTREITAKDVFGVRTSIPKENE